MKIWLKLPMIIRALILGVLITLIGVNLWPILALMLPMPLAVVLTLVYLWVFVKYLSGSWWPESTRAFRKENFRSGIQLDTKSLLLVALTIVLIVLIEQSGLVVTFRILDFPAEKFLEEYSFVEQLPAWAGWLAIIMISLVAGVVEEIGFRGYMQQPLEKKFNPIFAIVFVSIIFVVVHLHQAWSGFILIQIFLISALFGTVAYVTNSLIPGIIAHFLMDVCNFSFWWTDLGGQFDRDIISSTGVDTHFVIWSLVLVLSVVAFVLATRKLNKEKPD